MCNKNLDAEILQEMGYEFKEDWSNNKWWEKGDVQLFLDEIGFFVKKGKNRSAICITVEDLNDYLKSLDNEILYKKNTDDFNTMRSMLSDIEIGIMQMAPLKQFEFYQPIQELILCAWQEVGGYKQEQLNTIIKNG